MSAGEIFMEAVRRAGTELVPVDSEHSAAFQAIAGADPASIERIVLTASGGPFRTWSLEELARATPQQALLPSQLVDGPQDHHQFGDHDEQGAGADRGLPPVPRRAGPARGGRAPPVDHPCPCRHIGTARCWRSWPVPICARRSRVSLAWPSRMAAPTKRLDLVEIGQLSFERPDEHRFQAMGLARQAMRRGGMAPGRAQRGQRGGRRGLPGGTAWGSFKSPNLWQRRWRWRGMWAARRGHGSGCRARPRTPRHGGWR